MKVKCVVCGKEFIAVSKRITCSEECRRNCARRRLLRPRFECTCVICGKTFLAMQKNYVTCSKTCRHVRQLDNQKSFYSKNESNREKARIAAVNWRSEHPGYDAKTKARERARKELGLPLLLYAAMKIRESFQPQEVPND